MRLVICNLTYLEYLSGETDEIDRVLTANYESIQRFILSLSMHLNLLSNLIETRWLKIEKYINDYASRAQTDVFERYNPDTERWALDKIKLLEKEGLALENLLDRLKGRRVC